MSAYSNAYDLNHIRGQLVNLDPMTLKEREELRRKELKYQEEIRHQVEEKQRLKREERMQKLKEEAEEEAKFRAERNNAQREVQQAKEMNKLKEWDSGAKEVSRVDLVAEAMQKAKQEAEILKARRRLEKLQAAGHDITHLKAAYEEKFSPRVGPVISDMLSPRGAVGTTSTVPADILSSRTQNSQAQQHVVEPTAVPGLDLTSRANTRHTSRTDDGGYVSNRVVTPHKWQGAQKENLSPVKEFGVQTDTPPPSRSKGSQAEKKMNGGVKRKQVRVISGPKSRKGKETQEIKPWGWKNQVGKKFTAQSKRDPHYEEKQEEKVVRAQARKDQLLKQKSILKKPVRKVQANSKHYPDGKASRAAGDTNRDTVNSYLSPRYKITDSSSPRAGVQESAVTSSRIDKPPVAASKNTDKLRIGSKQSGRGKPAPHSSGYELTADNLQFAADDEFVPFRRSDAVLSPSNAQEVSPMSREQTQAALAREAYYKSMQPAQFGVQMHNIKDSHKTAHGKDPLYNPSLVTKHPTDRQQQVLDSLRQMRQGLMAKQREIASVMSPDLTDNVYS